MSKKFKCEMCKQWKIGYCITGIWLDTREIEYVKGGVWYNAKEVMSNKQICFDCADKIKNHFKI